MKRSLIVFACALAAISTSAFAADPIVIKVQAADDYVYTYDRSGGYTYTDTNVNASPNSASYYYDFWSGSGSIVNYTYTGMKFNISSISSDFTSAVFSFNLLSTDCGYGEEVGSGKLMHEGVELFRVRNQPLGWISVDVTERVLADKAAGNAFSTFTMTYVGNGYGSCGMSFSSGETEFGPRLTITSVPEPSSILALASGAVALLGGAYRRRRSL